MVNGIGGIESGTEAYRTGRLTKKSAVFSLDMRMSAVEVAGSAANGLATGGSQSAAASPAPRQDSVTRPAAATPAYAWRQDVIALTEMQDGSTRTDPVNLRQFATAETAEALADRLGLKSFGLNLTGFSRYSADVQMLNASGNPLEAGMNAGLVADTFARYGSGPGTYGQYLIDRDIAMLRGETIADPYSIR
jgi:hypothetical protein